MDLPIHLSSSSLLSRCWRSQSSPPDLFSLCTHFLSLPLAHVLKYPPQADVLVAAVTNYQQLSGLKQKNFVPSQFWEPEVQNQRHWLEIKEPTEPCCLWWHTPGRVLSLPLLVSGVACIPWIVTTSLHLRLPGHIASSSSMSGKSRSASPTRILVTIFWVHLDNPRESLHLKVLDNIHKYTFSLEDDIYWFQSLGPDIFFFNQNVGIYLK